MRSSPALVRLGGICAILFVLLLIPGLFIARPDVPDDSLSTRQVVNSFNDRQDVLMIGNGLSFIFAAFFFLHSSRCSNSWYRIPHWRCSGYWRSPC
jgi:hypothetical protein